MTTTDPPMEQAFLPDHQWRQCVPIVTSDIYSRNQARYDQVLDQFRVMTAHRYKPTDDGKTWCNIFVMDVCAAMDCPFPARDDDGKEFTANKMAAYLKRKGAGYGWSPVSMRAACLAALRGKPTTVFWHNPEGHGHTAMVVPSGLEPKIAQAGKVNLRNAPLVEGFGVGKSLAFWVHP